MMMETLKPVTDPLDVHLMIVQAEKYITDFAHSGADIFSVQVKAFPDLNLNLRQIKNLRKIAGAVFSPETWLNNLEYRLEPCDLVLSMSVKPGLRGQSFMEDHVQQIKGLRKVCDERGLLHGMDRSGWCN